MSATDPLPLAQGLIRCPSVTPADAGALGVLQAALEPLGFVCHRLTFADKGLPPVENLYARLGGQAPNFCFAGHTDVVPPGDTAAWRVDPFAGMVIDGALYGRGAADMKGAVAAFVAGVARFLGGGAGGAGANGGGFGGSISLLITGDEEGDAVNGTPKLLEWLQQQGERLDACLVGEPTCIAALGDQMKIGRRGSLTALITAHGTQGHVAYPQRADNPVHRLLRLLSELIVQPVDAFADRPGSGRFEPSNLEITTFDVGNPADNVIPARARASLNIRFNDRHSARSLIAWLRDRVLAAGGRFDMEVRVSGEAFVTLPGPLTDLVAGAVEQVTGLRPVLDTGGGTSDARFIRAHCPVVEFGPLNRTIHRIDEHVAVAELDRLAAVYAEVLKAYFGRGGPPPP